MTRGQRTITTLLAVIALGIMAAPQRAPYVLDMRLSDNVLFRLWSDGTLEMNQRISCCPIIWVGWELATPMLPPQTFNVVPVSMTAGGNNWVVVRWSDGSGQIVRWNISKGWWPWEYIPG